ncbi:hypothetical protein KUTeg_002482 [Tegillarca granosa]|uniref:PQ-loop repeat-containing protein 2 n=1 Tax=Tegillarca granosa TaxID=220873 RepID=A0ABQ9FYV1_TEGGR|nr:hypothetical protein KUTeg_002482 [Tegillarca granosa]
MSFVIMPGLYLWIFDESHHLKSNNYELSNGTVNGTCSDGIQWVWHILGDCITDVKGVVSLVFGIASILTWMVVTIPQMIKNCRYIKGIEGISIFLILQWTLGDSTNLIGAILTNQLPLQIYVAIYFVAADIVLFMQYIYYQLLKKKEARLEKLSQTGPSQLVLCFAGCFLMFQSMGICLQKYLSLNTGNQLTIRNHPAGRSLMAFNNLQHVEIFHNIKDEVGYGVGIISSLFYIGSRSAQIYKNFKRKSTDGLSILMFVLAIIGNLTYGLSILVRQQNEAFLIQHLPWLVGSLGVIFLDVTLVIQFKVYGGNEFDALSRKPLVDYEITVDDNIINDSVRVT